jgi:hypothetical protein
MLILCLVFLFYAKNLFAFQIVLFTTSPQSESIHFLNSSGEVSLAPLKFNNSFSPYLIKLEDIAFTDDTLLNIEYENNSNAMSGLHQKQTEINILGFTKKILVDTDLRAQHDIQLLKFNITPAKEWRVDILQFHPKIGLGIINSYLRVSSLDNSNDYSNSSTGLFPYVGMDMYFNIADKSTIFMNLDHGQAKKKSNSLLLQDLTLGVIYKSSSVNYYFGKTFQNLEVS